MEKNKIIDKKDLIKDTIILFVFDLINKSIYGRTYLQKLFYLFEKEFEKSKELNKESIFSYQPHFYGPFSRELNETLTKLSHYDYIYERRKGECYVYNISEGGKEFLGKNKSKVNPKVLKKIAQLCEYFKDFSATDLLKYVYKRFPEDTSRSIYWTTKESSFVKFS